MKRVYELTEADVREACALYVTKTEFRNTPTVVLNAEDACLSVSHDDRTDCAIVTATVTYDPAKQGSPQR